jgi:hypothetical protein
MDAFHNGLTLAQESTAMKAIRLSLGLAGLLLVSTFAHAYYWVTPVTRCPYPQAPSTWNSGYYLMDAYGRWTGPHYYLVPPTGPFNGFLPGPVGCAIMSGNLPHTLLMGKEGMNIGNMPMLSNGRGNSLFNFGGGGQNPGSMPPAGNPGFPYATTSGPPAQMQVPYGAPPMYNAGMPPYQMMPSPMRYPGQMPARPVAWQGHGYGQEQPSPFGPIPPFNAQGPQGGLPPLPPMQPMPQLQPPMPPYPQFSPFSPMQPPVPPNPNMQMPRMDYMPPPAPKANAFPVHPFTRSPRDFFMWSENMEDEARMRNRPFPVPR